MGDLVKGISWFPNKYIEASFTRYTLSWDGGSYGITMHQAAQHLRVAKKYPEAAKLFKLERKLITRILPACPWCGSRPRLLEHDCDGPYYTADCGSEQCRKGRGFH